VSGPFAASVAIFVQDPQAAPVWPGEAFAKLYGLTGGELRVLLAIAPGLGLKEAADILGIRETTAKTHLQRIFAKTGTSRQTELLHLLKNTASPLQRQ
jgi:DNA-binding CsgD family transcriptional regulator